MQFDRPVILAEYIRAGIPEPISRFPTFCTVLSTTEICRLPPMRYGKHKWPKLEELHYHLFQMEFSAGHDARADVRACAQCFFRLLEMGLISVEIACVAPAVSPPAPTPSPKPAPPLSSSPGCAPRAKAFWKRILGG